MSEYEIGAKKGKYDDGRHKGKYWRLTSKEVKEALIDKVEEVHDEKLPEEGEVEIDVEIHGGGSARIIAKGKKHRR
jgi:hypothetical protein